MRLHIIHAFLQGIGESLDDIRVFLYITLLRAGRRVGHIAAVLAKGSDDIAFPLGFQRGGAGFELNCIISLAFGKCGGSGSEVDILVDLQIRSRIDAVFLQDILKDHLRHAAFAAAEDQMPFQVIPGEIRHFLARDEEVAGALGELGKIHHVVGGAFCVSVDRGFRSHEADIRLAGNDGGHRFVSAKRG